MHGPQVSPAVRQSQAALVIAESRPADPFPTATRALGHTAMVWPGIKQGELQRVAQPVELASVLLLRCVHGSMHACVADCFNSPNAPLLGGTLCCPCRSLPFPHCFLCRGHVPGYHGGFDTPAANLAFDGSFNKTILEYNELPFWCCFTWCVAQLLCTACHFVLSLRPAPPLSAVPH